MKGIVKNFEEIVSGLSLAIVICVVIVNVLMRFVTGSSLLWADEIAVMGFVWSIFLGASACYKRGAHIGIDILTTLLKGKAKKTVTLAADVLLIIVNLGLTYWSWVFALSAWSKLTGVLQIHYTFIDISATIAFALTSVHAVRHFILDLQGRNENDGQEKVILDV